jgi:hypothetical protein
VPVLKDFLVEAPASATAGSPVSVKVTARDQNDATLTSYDGPVSFTSTDAAAVLPGSTSLVNGIKTVDVTLKTAGSRTVSVSGSGKSGTSSAVSVGAGAAKALSFTTQPSDAVAGAALPTQPTSSS